MPTTTTQRGTAAGVRERLALYGRDGISDGDLMTALVGRGLPRGWPDLDEMHWRTPDQFEAMGYTPAMAERLFLAFELGRRAAQRPPKRGDRCLDPAAVYQLMRDAARAEAEEFWTVLLDVRGRLICRERIAVGSLTQCPVDPRAVLLSAVRVRAHSMVLVHNHPSGDPSPSPDDGDLTERLRACAELLGLVVRDHVIVAATGYYSFVEAGRWRR